MTTTVETPEITPTDPAQELIVLRETNKQLLAKLHERKARIEELETSTATLERRVNIAELERHDALVGVPLRKLAEEVSTIPGLWLEQFTKRYNVALDKTNALQITTKDGKPALDRNGKPVKFEPNAIWQLCTGGAASYAKDDDGKMFGTIMRWMGPSGTGAHAANGSPGSPSKSTTGGTKKSQNNSLGFR